MGALEELRNEGVGRLDALLVCGFAAPFEERLQLGRHLVRIKCVVRIAVQCRATSLLLLGGASIARDG